MKNFNTNKTTDKKSLTITKKTMTVMIILAFAVAALGYSATARDSGRRIDSDPMLKAKGRSLKVTDYLYGYGSGNALDWSPGESGFSADGNPGLYGTGETGVVGEADDEPGSWGVIGQGPRGVQGLSSGIVDESAGVGVWGGPLEDSDWDDYCGSYTYGVLATEWPYDGDERPRNPYVKALRVDGDSEFNGAISSSNGKIVFRLGPEDHQQMMAICDEDYQWDGPE